MEKKPRPHAELIIAWADGAEIQYRKPGAEDWTDCADPAWVHDYEYRVKPARIYPQSCLSYEELHAAYVRNREGDDPIWSSKGCEQVANAAIIDAIDNGQVVTREEFNVLADEVNRTRNFALNKWRESIVGFGMIEGQKEVVQAIKDVLDSVAKRDMAVAKHVRHVCYTSSQQTIGRLNLEQLIAEVKA